MKIEEDSSDKILQDWNSLHPKGPTFSNFKQFYSFLKSNAAMFGSDDRFLKVQNQGEINQNDYYLPDLQKILNRPNQTSFSQSELISATHKQRKKLTKPLQEFWVRAKKLKKTSKTDEGHVK